MPKKLKKKRNSTVACLKILKPLKQYVTRETREFINILRRNSLLKTITPENNSSLLKKP